MLSGVDEAKPLRKGPDLLLLQLAQGELCMGQLFLRHSVEHVALIFMRIRGFFEQIPAGRPVINDTGIMAGRQIDQTFLPCDMQEPVKFQIAVAVNAGIRGVATLITLDKPLDDLLPEFCSKIQHPMGDIQLKRHFRCVFYILLGTAGMEARKADIHIAIQTHGCPCAMAALLQQKVSRNRAVHPAAHGDEDACTRFHWRRHSFQK